MRAVRQVDVEARAEADQAEAFARLQPVAAGERFGLIRFGSRLDVFLPAGAQPRVALGQTATAGETVLAEFGSLKGPVVSRRS